MAVPVLVPPRTGSLSGRSLATTMGQDVETGATAGSWLDWYVAPYVMPCDDCIQLTPSSFRVGRGGGYKNAVSELRAARRASQLFEPGRRYPDVGVRCARAP